MRKETIHPESTLLAVGFLLGLMIIVLSLQLGFRRNGELGPGFFPFWVGGLISTASSLLLIKSWRRNEHAERQPLLSGNQWRRLIGGVLSFLGWVILIPYLGYALVTFLFALFYSKILGLEGWVRPLVLSIGIIVFIYLLFSVWFYVDLPKGLFG